MWIRVHRIGAATLVVLVAVQAVIAGQHLFGGWGIGVHAAFGNASFSIAILIAAVAIFRLDSRSLSIVGVVMVLLLSAQIGLGYSARDSEAAAALHIPLGVAVFGALTYQLMAAWPALVIRAATRDRSDA